MRLANDPLTPEGIVKGSDMDCPVCGRPRGYTKAVRKPGGKWRSPKQLKTCGDIECVNILKSQGSQGGISRAEQYRQMVADFPGPEFNADELAAINIACRAFGPKVNVLAILERLGYREFYNRDDLCTFNDMCGEILRRCDAMSDPTYRQGKRRVQRRCECGGIHYAHGHCKPCYDRARAA